MTRTNIFHYGLLITFAVNAFMPPAKAWGLALPAPGIVVNLSHPFTPAHLTGIMIDPKDPLRFDFMVRQGEGTLTSEQKRQEYARLIKYFLASLTVPDHNQWVNLSPYEKDRIITADFGQTQMGRDLLAQDYLLKQISSSLMYPESEIGKTFWDRVYVQAQQKLGHTRIPVQAINKVWITPAGAEVLQSGHTAYITHSRLKVMIEEDYVALRKGPKVQESATSAKALKEVIVPALEREVNEGKNFAMLRQVYSGMILATWFKKTLKESLLGQLYADQSKVLGIDVRRAGGSPEMIYQAYLTALKKGVYNYIKTETDPMTNQSVPRKYFAGGFDGAQLARSTTIRQVNLRQLSSVIDPELQDAAMVNLLPAKSQWPGDYLARIAPDHPDQEHAPVIAEPPGMNHVVTIYDDSRGFGFKRREMFPTLLMSQDIALSDPTDPGIVQKIQNFQRTKKGENPVRQIHVSSAILVPVQELGDLIRRAVIIGADGRFLSWNKSQGQPVYTNAMPIELRNQVLVSLLRASAVDSRIGVFVQRHILTQWQANYSFIDMEYGKKVIIDLIGQILSQMKDGYLALDLFRNMEKDTSLFRIKDVVNGTEPLTPQSIEARLEFFMQTRPAPWSMLVSTHLNATVNLLSLWVHFDGVSSSVLSHAMTSQTRIVDAKALYKESSRAGRADLRKRFAELILVLTGGKPTGNKLVPFNKDADRKIFYALGDEGTIVGMVTSRRLNAGTNIARINDLVVEADHRQDGIGKLLMIQVMAALHRDGVLVAQWSSSENSIGFYEKIFAPYLERYPRWSRANFAINIPELYRLQPEFLLANEDRASVSGIRIVDVQKLYDESTSEGQAKIRERYTGLLNLLAGLNHLNPNYIHFLAAQPGDRDLVALDDQGEIQGVISSTDLGPGAAALVSDLVVAPGYRKNGVGVMLIQRLLADLYEHGVTSVSWESLEESRPFYEKIFKPYLAAHPNEDPLDFRDINIPELYRLQPGFDPANWPRDGGNAAMIGEGIDRRYGKPKAPASPAMMTKGGIDFQKDKLDLTVKHSNHGKTNSGSGTIDAAMLKTLRDVSGFVPVIDRIAPLSEVWPYHALAT